MTKSVFFDHFKLQQNLKVLVTFQSKINVHNVLFILHVADKWLIFLSLFV